MISFFGPQLKETSVWQHGSQKKDVLLASIYSLYRFPLLAASVIPWYTCPWIHKVSPTEASARNMHYKTESEGWPPASCFRAGGGEQMSFGSSVIQLIFLYWLRWLGEMFSLQSRHLLLLPFLTLMLWGHIIDHWYRPVTGSLTPESERMQTHGYLCLKGNITILQRKPGILLFILSSITSIIRRYFSCFSVWKE